VTDKKRAPRVALIDNSIDPGIYRPVEHWSRYLTIPWDAFIARKGRFPDTADYTHIILTGSEASILERDAWVDAEASLVREAVAGGAAVLGRRSASGVSRSGGCSAIPKWIFLRG